MSIKEGSLGAPIRHPIDWENPISQTRNCLTMSSEEFSTSAMGVEDASIYVKVSQNYLT